MGSAGRHGLAALVLLTVTLTALATACGRAPEDGPATRNVLLVTLDTTRADALSCLGGDPRATPNIDALARRSTLFTRAVSEANVTNPSHVSILSGQRVIQHRVFSNAAAMPADLDTVALALGRQGYQTAAFVAVPFLSSVPGWRGFDSFPETRAVQRARVITRRGLEWLEQRDPARPFFLWAHYFDPHSVYAPAAEDAALFYRGDPTAGDAPPIAEEPYFQGAEAGVVRWLTQLHGPIRDRAWPRAMYQAEVHAMDREIGRLLDGLARLGLEQDTLVVLVGDHGESLGEHGIWYDHKGLFEQQLRIPLVIHVPGLEPRRTDALVSTLDVAPTLEELLGFRLRTPTAGVSLVPLLHGRTAQALSQRRVFVHQAAHNSLVAARADGWKLVWPLGDDQGPLPDVPLLFDLAADPGEQRNLYAAEPERAEALRRQLEPWLELGPVERGAAVELPEEVLRGLRSLGYADHLGG